MRLRFCFAAALVLSASLAARADSIFQLSNTTFTTMIGGTTTVGTLTGTFTTNNARSAITGYDLTASAAGSFLGYRYTPLTSTVTASVLPSQYFQLDSPGSLNELRIYFVNGLTATGGQISATFSYEAEPSGGNRFPSGSVVPAVAATPEPSSIALLGTGLVGIGSLIRKRYQQ